ncbi:MAG TPA: hypothetical protein VF615_06720 [Longimicrobiaceae bacterium]|jgi:hypothetical protein
MRENLAAEQPEREGLMPSQRDTRDAPGFRAGNGFVRDDEDRIVLHPPELIPDGEAWLWKSPALRSSMERALRQADSGTFEELGSFTRFSEDCEP